MYFIDGAIVRVGSPYGVIYLDNITQKWVSFSKTPVLQTQPPIKKDQAIPVKEFSVLLKAEEGGTSIYEQGLVNEQGEIYNKQKISALDFSKKLNSDGKVYLRVQGSTVLYYILKLEE